MNATSLDELRSASTAMSRDARDEKMEQVRQLLYGDHAREVSTRFMLIEARLHDLEIGMARQLEAMALRIEELASGSEASRKNAFDELARSIHELGDRIGGFSKP